MKPPLDGIRILDLTIWQMGPQATLMLADMGAEVIKIETPVTGDPSRSLVFKDPAETHGIIPYFQVMDRNKKSMTLNLGDERGRRVFYQLVRGADVVIQNWRIGVAEKLGVDYETLASHNPEIIVALGSSYGLEGPDARVGSTDISGVARSGMTHFQSMSIPGESDDIFYSLVAEADASGAMMLAYAVLLGLMARQRHGVGQLVEVSQLAATMWLEALPLGLSLIHGDSDNLPIYKRTTRRNFLWKHYRCADGRWIVLSQPQPQLYWSRFIDVMGLSHLESDPRYIKMRDSLNFYGALAEQVDIEEIARLIDEAFLTRPAAEWVKLMRDKDIDCTLVNDYNSLVSDPQVIANDYISEIEHPTGVPLKVIGIPVKLSKTPGHIASCAPEFGQHTEELLLAEGYTWEQIGELRENGVI